LNYLLSFYNILLSLLPLLLLLLQSELLHILFIPLLKRSLDGVRLWDESVLVLLFGKQTGLVLVMDVFHVVIFGTIET
jgi:hypothetical protein